jgi:hypothetical protein
MAATEETNAAEAAAQVRAERDGGADAGAPASPKRGRGRPKGSKTRTRTTRTTKPEENDDEKREPYKATPEGIASAQLLCATAWTIAAPMLKLDSLTEDEAEQLGKAVDPILHKYVPLLDDWREEINLVVAVVGAFQVTRQRYRAAHPEEFARRPVYADLHEENGAGVRGAAVEGVEYRVEASG